MILDGGGGLGGGGGRNKSTRTIPRLLSQWLFVQIWLAAYIDLHCFMNDIARIEIKCQFHCSLMLLHNLDWIRLCLISYWILIYGIYFMYVGIKLCIRFGYEKIANACYLVVLISLYLQTKMFVEKWSWKTLWLQHSDIYTTHLLILSA